LNIKKLPHIQLSSATLLYFLVFSLGSDFPPLFLLPQERAGFPHSSRYFWLKSLNRSKTKKSDEVALDRASILKKHQDFKDKEEDNFEELPYIYCYFFIYSLTKNPPYFRLCFNLIYFPKIFYFSKRRSLYDT
jgi:hypothetical protein